MKKFLTKDATVIVLVVLIVAQFVVWGWMMQHQRNINKRYDQDISTLQRNNISISNGQSYQQVTVSPVDKKIYLPQLNLSIPLSALGTSLVYSPDTAYVTGSNKAPSGPLDEATISTSGTASATQTQTQFDCSGLVRIRFESAPNPYNPSETSIASVTLSNGKTLQVYANHRQQCQKEWSVLQVSPDAVAALFKDAESY